MAACQLQHGGNRTTNCNTHCETTTGRDTAQTSTHQPSRFDIHVVFSLKEFFVGCIFEEGCIFSGCIFSRRTSQSSRRYTGRLQGLVIYNENVPSHVNPTPTAVYISIVFQTILLKQLAPKRLDSTQLNSTRPTSTLTHSHFNQQERR